MRATFLPRPTTRSPQLVPLEPVPITETQRRTAHMAASLLLAYPEDDLPDLLAQVRPALADLPLAVRDRLVGVCDALDSLEDRQSRYVATFDLKRRCAMYLSYYAAGDTRRRGNALVRFVEAYRAAGWEVTGSELPDYLPMVLEFSARSTGDDATIAGGLLASHREGIEVLRSALAAERSPWTGAVEAVCLTLPRIDERTLERYLALVTDGPPSELVGLTTAGPLEPFGAEAQR
ncbi:MAG TPA: nitrate reductase molybdenum cofactor assembly chaperone [Cellulomonas sp.]|nr:nitrate reductase molybdenum cofactor assembly chaperone [Cellulomonas sp.]